MEIITENFTIIQLSTSCLSQFAYYIESDKEAVIIDPLRETHTYLNILQQRKAKLKFIIETHFHADFVSGHSSLSNLTNSKIIFGPNSSANFDHLQKSNGDEIKLGKIKLRVMHTPGHTLESICLVLNDEGKDKFIFTGDTLFIGDVGRPDLSANSSSKLTKEYMAGKLFHSLQEIKKLDENCVVFPGHGEGSQCGKQISKEITSTIKTEKMRNYALLIDDKDIFIEEICKSITSPPDYFFYNAKLNQNNMSVQLTEEILKIANNELYINEFSLLVSNQDY